MLIPSPCTLPLAGWKTEWDAEGELEDGTTISSSMDESLTDAVAEPGLAHPPPPTTAPTETEDPPKTAEQPDTDQTQPLQVQDHGLDGQDLEMPDDDALLAIDLRIRLLETVLAGSVSSSDAFQHRVSSTDRRQIGTRAETIVKTLNDVLQAKPNDVVRRFVQSCEYNRPPCRLFLCSQYYKFLG